MILLDTHVVIWLLVSPEELSDSAHDVISRARATGDKVACSQASFYEIANAVRRRRLRVESSARDFIAVIQASIAAVPLTTEILVLAAELADPFRGDPFDRIIAATAIVENCSLISADRKMLASGVCKTIW